MGQRYAEGAILLAIIFIGGTPLRGINMLRRKKLNPVSKKQRIRNKKWTIITLQKAMDLHNVCQWCGERGRSVGVELYDLSGHHAIRRTREGSEDTPENCYLCHNRCHTIISHYNIDVNQYPNKLVWEAK